jgi:hypothetical protein
MGLEAYKVLESYLEKKINQLKKDYQRLDITKASKGAVLRLEKEENDIRLAATALSELRVSHQTKEEEVKDLQHQLKIKNLILQETQLNVDCLKEGLQRASESEDRMLTWIVKTRNGLIKQA